MKSTEDLMAALRLWRDVYAGHAIDTAMILDDVEAALIERDQLRKTVRAWVNTHSHHDCAACGAIEVELSKQ